MTPPKVPDIASLSDEELLKTRLCNLNLSIAGTWLEECVDQLYKELSYNKIKFKPKCYLADEWLAPENEPIVGIAFFLAHPRLMELEKTMIHEVEGGTKESCMKLLRHETGHAVNYAYQFYKRKRWKELFGSFSADYPDRYKYKPYSKNFVIHLEEYYAQYHPDEDFSETFAVWLSPDSNWEKKYKKWKKAYEKLLYVDSLMKEISRTPPKRKRGRKYWSVNTLKMTLETYYKRKTEFYAEYSPGFHDFYLKQIFEEPGKSRIKAFKIITKNKTDILRLVSSWTGEKKHVIQKLLKSISKRSRELKLSSADEKYELMGVISYITTLTMNYIFTGRFKR